MQIEGQDGASGFHVAGYRGAVNGRLAPVDIADAIGRLTDPGRARETIHWGRNYLYSLDLETVAGEVEVVVKQFRNQGLAARLRRRWHGDKATKSWRAAWALLEAGVRTPLPVMVVESEAPEGPSFYVALKLEDFFESRYFFRALIAGRERELFPEVDRDELIAALGSVCRRVHDAGIWHRDISIGNLLVGTQEGRPTVTVIDLNRAKHMARMGLLRRTRDLCRLPFPGADHRRVFLTSYWRQPVAPGSLRYRIFWTLQQGFLLKNRAKAAARRPFGALRDLLRERRPHAHIPPAPEGATARDKIVWDHLSDQPHQHATRAERTRVRMSDIGAHAEAARALLTATPRIWRRYRRLRSRLFTQPVPWAGVGVAVRPHPEDPQGLVDALLATGVDKVLLRLHPWEEDHSAELELASALHRLGYELAFALPQNRELVQDLGRWSAAVERLAEAFAPLGQHFQLGQAINRSKWGVWTYREYLDMAVRASEILRRHDGVEIMGPAVIDFELQATAAVVNMRREGLHFDILSSLLYVDRRGAPENPQLGFDGPAKAALLKAIAETGRSSSGRCWVTEVNWPLWEGPHSPAGRTVSVDEETQADYLARYYLLMLASGMIERVYWWRMIARGYGLAEPGSAGNLRLRPSHRTLATMQSVLGDGMFRENLAAPADTRLMLFDDRVGRELVVGWSPAGPTPVDLPRPASSACDRNGDQMGLENPQRVELVTGPRYFHLEP